MRSLLTFLFIVVITPSALADQNHPELDPLFADLKASDDLIEMVEIQNEIWVHWYTLPPEATELQSIFDLGMSALEFAQPEMAITHFTRVIEAAPEFAEAWNRRATTYYMVGDLDASLQDIQATLALEPRHFGALSGLSMIFESTGDLERAIRAEKLLLDLMPNNPMVQERLRGLKTKLESGGI
jgi:tetratricopeptide (TPR) repeat protein